MRMQVLQLAIFFSLSFHAVLHVNGDDGWPIFRGVNSSGRAVGNLPLPTEIGPNENVVWKIKLPPGHSSPVIVGDRIYVTAVREERLVTIAIARNDGKILWEKLAPHKKLETIHSIGSHAQSTAAADGERVVSFFGSAGLFCYDASGKLLWDIPMGPFNNDFGAASSPIISGDYVILCQDHDTDSFLTAIHKETGKVVWRTDRSEFPRNFCTPVVWENEGRKQIVVAATLRVVGYDFATGKEVWTVRGISRTVCMTPVVGEDGNLYVAGWAAGGDKEEPIRVDSFDKAAPELDKNKDGEIDESELSAHPFKQRFSQVDRDNSGRLSKNEWDYFQQLFENGRNLVLAIRPGGTGDVSESHVLWRHERFIPFCASPLFYKNRIYTVKDGGIVSCLDAKTGKPYKQGRVPATGAYYSSPVAGDDKVFLLSQKGKLTVLSATDQWKTLHSADFEEECYATPALLDGKIYLRTNGHLYCFAIPASAE